MRPFRFGLLVEKFNSPNALIDTARRAELDGFSTLLVRDHLVAQPFGPQYAPWSTLACVAQATSTLRVGTLVIDNDFRHPTVLAKEATTLDQLSGGRVELGLGAGFLREEYRQAGLTYDKNSVRVDRLEEALIVLNALMRGQPVAYQGQHYQLDDFTSYPPPFQAPRPPLLVGGAGRRMLTLGGKYGDIVGLLPTALHAGGLVDSPEARLSSRVAQQVQIIRQAAGDRFSHIELSLIVSLVGRAERMAAARQVADERGWNVSADAVLQMPSILVGDTSAMAESLLETRETLGVSYIVVRDSQLELATPVVRRLAGR
jgi:probable F420-dependent oxidoreductase